MCVIQIPLIDFVNTSFPKKQDTLKVYYLPSIKHHTSTTRYWYIKCETMQTDGREINGDFWFSSDGMPTKNSIDSTVFDALPMKKSCYQRIIIDFIYEFKTQEDFEYFGLNYKSSPTYKKHSDCETHSFKFKSWPYDGEIHRYSPDTIKPWYLFSDPSISDSFKLDTSIHYRRLDGVNISKGSSPFDYLDPFKDEMPWFDKDGILSTIKVPHDSLLRQKFLDSLIANQLSRLDSMILKQDSERKKVKMLFN